MRLNKSSNRYRYLKYILTIVFSIILAGIVELGFNYHSLLEHYDPINLIETGKNTGGKTTYLLEMEQPLYIKKLQLNGDFTEDGVYYINYTMINDFGKEEEKSTVDYLYPEIPQATTNIGKKVSKIEIQVDSNDAANLKQVLISNDFQLNKYRLLLVFLVFFSFYLIFFEKKLITEKIEYFFLIYALAFGGFLILIAGPKSVTWDEETHYGRVYRMASDSTVEWSQSAWDFYNRKIPEYNSKDEFAQLKYYLNSEEGKQLAKTEERESTFIAYDHRTYLPMALMYQLGEMLNLSFSNNYMFGKLGNLFLYVLLIFLAIHLSRKGKIFLTAISLMPTVLFQGSMYTYDGLVYAFLVLGCVLWKNEYECSSEKLNWKYAFCMIFCIVMGSLSKAVYIPLILSLLMFPKTKFWDKKTERMFKSGVFLIFLLMMWTFVMPAISNTVAGNLSYGGDARGGDTSTARQLLSMLHHPFSSVKLIIENIFSLENFRNVGRAELDDVIASNLTFLSFGGNGVLSEKWSLFLLPLLGMLFFVPSEEDRKEMLTKKTKLLQSLILLVIVVLIWVALYLSFTPVGQDTIEGVQARYYLPILLPLAYVTWSNGFQSNLKVITYRRIVLTAVNVFMFQCIYQLFLVSKCW